MEEKSVRKKSLVRRYKNYFSVLTILKKYTQQLKMGYFTSQRYYSGMLFFAIRNIDLTF